jgi:hypothetical protein
MAFPRRILAGPAFDAIADAGIGADLGIHADPLTREALCRLQPGVRGK